MRWIAISLFAPEVVVYNAWMQRRRVCQITRTARKSQQLAKALGNPQVFEWTQYHSWYMIMGGFYFKTNNNGADDDFIPGSPDLLLTHEAIDLLTKTSPPLLPEIEVEAIKDSRADFFAKALALLLILYQFLSVVARLVLGLPVTQLEINTLGHVLCAFGILIIWFRKPRIKARTQIRDEWANPLCAYLWMSREFGWNTQSTFLEIEKLFPPFRKTVVVENAAAGKDEHSQVGGGDELTIQAGERYYEGRRYEAECTNHRTPLEKSSEATDLLSTKPQTWADPVCTPFSDISSPSRFLASICEHSHPVLTTQQLSLGNDDGLKNTCSKVKPASSWTSWALPRIDPVQDPETFEEILRPALKEKFQVTKVVYDSTTIANRACLAMSYVRYWTFNTVNWSNGVKPFLGVKGYTHSVRPPVYHGTLITDHISDWFKDRSYGMWCWERAVPALSTALLTICYGALHGWAWHDHFPTTVSFCLYYMYLVFGTSLHDWRSAHDLGQDNLHYSPLTTLLD